MNLSESNVLVVGCVHSNSQWLTSVVLPTAARMGVGAILVAGDFGYWSDNPKFIEAASNSRSRCGVDTWFIDGNHEDYPRLLGDVAANRLSGDGERSPVQLGDSLYYIPRLGRVDVGGLSVVGLGGAVSIDKHYRREGIDWFAEEAISEADLEAAKMSGAADVLISHDAPSGWEIPGLAPRSTLTAEWKAMLPECDEHREMLRKGYELIRPRILIHSHYHTGYATHVEEQWGSVAIVGLDRDGSQRWGRVLSNEGGMPILSDWVSVATTTN